MEKKSIVLELPCELIEKIDSINSTGDRSSFVSYLLEKQLQSSNRLDINLSSELTSNISKNNMSFNDSSGKIDILNGKGLSLGKFDINTVDGFEKLAKKIQEVSEDSIVQIRVKSWL